MERTRLWRRWTTRDLRGRWVQVLVIATIIAIGTSLYSGLTSTSQWRRESYDRSYDALAVHDVRVALTAGTSAPRGSLAAVADSLGASIGVRGAIERFSAPTQVDASTGDRTILVAGRIVGVDLHDGPSIDKIGVLAGRGLTAADAAVAHAVVDVHFAQHYHLPATGTVRVGANHQLDYVGHGEAPEQFLSLTDSGSLFAEASFAFFYTSIETAQRLTGAGDVVNELVVQLEPGRNRAQAAAALQAAFASRTSLATEVTALDDERVHSYLYGDIDSDQRFFNIFAMLVLLGASFAAFNLTGRMVEAQRREIGIGMALGAPGWLLALRPLVVALEIILGGVVLGVAGGLGVNALMKGLLKGFLPLPVWTTPLQLDAFARGASLGMILPFVATVWPVARAVRVAPIDALRTAQLARSGGALAPLLRRVRLPGSSIDQMPLRDTLRAPRRTLLTTAGVATAVATLVAVIGMVDTFFATIDRGEREIVSGHPSRMTVELTGLQPLDSPAARAVAAATTIETAVPMLQVGVTLRSATDPVGFASYLTLVDFTNPLWVPTATAGTLDRAPVGVVLSEKAARDLGVRVGDTVTMQHPRRTGLTGYTLVTSEVTVVALHPNPYRFVAFMDIAHADLLNLAGAVNLFQVAPTPGTAPEAVQRELFGTPGIAAAQPVTVVVRAIRDFIGEILNLLDVVQGAVLLLALLIAFNSSSISADERRRQHATMFAFGLPVWRVMLMSITESAFIGVLGTASGIGLGYVILDWIVHFLIPDTLPELSVTTHLAGSTVLTAAALGVVAVTIAPLFTLRRLTAMKIPETLRVQE